MIAAPWPGSLAQRACFALNQALLRAQRPDAALPHGRAHRLGDLLIDGVSENQLPVSLARARSRSPDSATLLAINTFLPWQREANAMPLAGWLGFQEIRFQVRCPTGLRGTPPHLHVFALREDVVLAVTVRCCEYLVRRRSPVSASYDRLLAITPGLEPWRAELERWRTAPGAFRFVDVGALVKYALALARTFPERPATLLYLFWEPLDAGRFEEFRCHRHELAALAEATRAARITFVAQSFTALWDEWGRRNTPAWLADHVLRLRARYGVAIAGDSGL